MKNGRPTFPAPQAAIRTPGCGVQETARQALNWWSLEDLLNNVQRFGVSELTAGGGNAQSFLNGAGTGSVCFQCSSNSGHRRREHSQRRRDTHHRVELRQQRQHLPTRAPGLLQPPQLWRGAWDCASTGACDLHSKTPTAYAHHIRLFNGAGTEIDSESTRGGGDQQPHGGGTGPFTVYGGGASYYATKLFQVQNNGNGTANYLLPPLAAGAAITACKPTPAATSQTPATLAAPAAAQAASRA